jgi:hypothetical protein
MASRWAPAAVLLALGASCGDVHDLHIGETPQVVLRGQVVRQQLDVNADAHLVAALVWTRESVPNPYCPLYASVLGDYCPDPNDVIYAPRAAVAAPVDGTGAFELRLSDASMGGATIGSLIVVEDQARDGFANYARQGRPGPGFENRPRPENENRLDPIVAASFFSRRGEQVRVLNLPTPRADSGTPAYPTPPCPVGFSGYSYLRIESDFVRCKSSPVNSEERVQLLRVPPTKSRALSCLTTLTPRWSVMPATDFQPVFIQGDRTVCLTRELFAAVDSAVCPAMTVWALKGCTLSEDFDPDCSRPDFDRTNDPPVWWPCH